MHGANEYDVVVAGAGVAGLSAALVLGRSGRRTLVLDGGEPRNAPSPAVHGFFSRDGIPPAELLRIGREQLVPYPDVRLLRSRALDAKGEDGAFEVVLEDGAEVRARKILLASGVVDELPDVPGFRELWGQGVYHCPYCHGWEVRDRPLAVLAAGEEALHRVPLIRNWSRDLVLCSDGPLGLDETGRRKLEALGAGIREQKISSLEGGDGKLRSMVFEDGSRLAREALFFMPEQRQRSELAEALGCRLIEGEFYRTIAGDPASKETSVPGVYAAGDAACPKQSAILAAASGANAAYAVNHALSIEDAEVLYTARSEPEGSGA